MNDTTRHNTPFVGRPQNVFSTNTPINIMMKSIIKSYGKQYQFRPKKIEAVRINAPFTVDTVEGKITGDAGDFLVEYNDGVLAIFSPIKFEETFSEVEEDRNNW